MFELNFITDEKLRLSLETDLNELNSCMAVESWKAVHVLAGSVIEAVLVDYLISIGYDSDRAKEMTLGRLITECKDQGIISERTFQLSSVIKEYRNLIHPGRLIRLTESVDSDSAKVAEALIGMVIRDVSATKMEDYGYTAEQIMDKLEKDPSVTAILGHLIKTLKPLELLRLVKQIPERYLDLLFSGEEAENLKPFEECFRLSLSSLETEQKKYAASRFVTILKEERKTVVLNYGNAFFRASDYALLSAEDKSLVFTHFMSRLENGFSESLRNILDGILTYLDVASAEKFVDILVRLLIITPPAAQREDLLHFIQLQAFFDTGDGHDAYLDRLIAWKDSRASRLPKEILDALSETVDLLKSYYEIK